MKKSSFCVMKVVEKRKKTAAEKREYDNTHTPVKKRMCLRSVTNMRKLKRGDAPVVSTQSTKQVIPAEKSSDRMRNFRPSPKNASPDPRLSKSRPIARRIRVVQNHDTPLVSSQKALTNRHGTPLSQKRDKRRQPESKRSPCDKRKRLKKSKSKTALKNDAVVAQEPLIPAVSSTDLVVRPSRETTNRIQLSRKDDGKVLEPVRNDFF